MKPENPVVAALESLSQAHGPAALREAWSALQRRVRGARRTDGGAQTLGRIIMEAIAYREGLKAAGATRADLDAGLESVVRAAWPKPIDRVTPWRTLCDKCQDTGLEMRQCTPDTRCNGVSTRTDSPLDKPGKYRRLCVGSATYEHDYGVPCTCAKGDTFRPRAARADEEGAFVAATKSKPKSFTRWGR